MYSARSSIVTSPVDSTGQPRDSMLTIRRPRGACASQYRSSPRRRKATDVASIAISASAQGAIESPCTAPIGNRGGADFGIERPGRQPEAADLFACQAGALDLRIPPSSSTTRRGSLTSTRTCVETSSQGSSPCASSRRVTAPSELPNPPNQRVPCQRASRPQGEKDASAKAPIIRRPASSNGLDSPSRDVAPAADRPACSILRGTDVRPRPHSEHLLSVALTRS